MKKCLECLIEKEDQDFYSSRRKPGQLSWRCRQCWLRIMAEGRAKRDENCRQRAAEKQETLRLAGLVPTEGLSEQQAVTCACCSTRSKFTLVLDYNRSKMICRKCKNLLALLRDSAELASCLVNYIG